MADMDYGGWYNNPDAGGKNMRFWGDKGWTDGAEPGGAPSGGGGGSSPSVPSSQANPAAYDNLLQSMPKATDLVGGINNNENAALGDYFGYLKSQDSPLSFFTKASDAQGIPQLRKTQSTLQGQIYDLEDTLRRIEPNVTATTGQSMVTEAQRQGMVTERQKPVLENLGWLGQSLGRVSSAITEGNKTAMDLTQLQQQGTQQFIDAYKTKLQVVSEQGSRALQAFINDNENILNVTLAKIHRGEQVSDQEAQNAFEMMKMQESAKLQLQAPNNEVIEANGHKLLIDKNTGKTIADLGSSKSGSSDISSDPYGKYSNNQTPASNSDYELLPNFTNILDYNKWLTQQNAH